jgi:serine/threonine protein kinase
MGSDEKALSRKETARGARVLPESQRTYGNVVHNESPGSNIKRSFEFSLEQKWIIDPTLLFVGPKIGEGAHGKVYEGKYLDHEVAVKILQPPATLEDVPKMESRFAREVDMLSRVQHKNLVKFVGACKEPVMVIVTELLGGKSLRKYMASHRPKRIDLRRAVSYALDIAQAMDCLHLNGIIHRDLKPDNLLLTADQRTVKLVDFGLAREETLTEMMTAETGTYRWMAPELYSTVTLRNGEKKHYNHKVDVYSFSIVLWELLVNRMPFEGMSNLQAAYAAAFKKVRPEVGKENFPSELVFILQSCWAEDPEARPNFTQVVRMLNAFLSTLPPATPPPCSPPYPIAPSQSSLQKEADVLKLDQSSNSTGNAGIVTKTRGLFLWFGQCFMAGPEASKSTST